MSQSPNYIDLPIDGITTQVLVVPTVASLPIGLTILEGAIRYVHENSTLYVYNGTIWSPLGGGGGGSVTSVGLAAPAEYIVSGSPVTSAGTLTLTKATQTANQIYAGPASGAAAQPTFRAQVVADLPTGIPATSIGAGTVSNTELGYVAGTTSPIQTQLNAKQATLTPGSISTSTTGLTVGNGAASTVGPNVTVNVQTASASQPGLLSAADFTTFNGKQPAGNYITTLTGDVVAAGPGSSSATIQNNAVTTSKIAAAAVDLTTKVTGILPQLNGGTGNSTYTDGQLLIGNTSTTGLTKAAITAGSGISVTNGNGSITIAATGGAGTVTGPGSSVDSQVALFNGTSGAVIKASTASGVAHLSTGVLTASNVSLTTEVTGILPIVSGGTNSNTALNNNRIIQSAGGAIVEAAAITINQALISDANGIPTASATTATELAFVNGVTSSIQTQLNTKAPTGNYITALTGDVTASGPGSSVATIAVGAVTDTKASLATKPAVMAAAITNQTLSGFPTIDGQTPISGSVILLTAQTSGSENGPWVAAAGAWSRPTWYPSGGTTQAFQFITSLVRLGANYQGTTWRITSAGAVTIDTTATTWAVVPLALNASTVTGLLPGTNGGTGISSTATFPSSGIVVTEAAVETLTNKVISGSTNTITNVSLTTGVTGILPTPNGGTGINAPTANSLLVGNGSSALNLIAPGSSGNILTSNGSIWSSTAPATNGTVTSVAMTVPSDMSISGSPITTSGTLAVTRNTQAANLVFAGPTSGSAAIPTYRSVIPQDVPAFALAYLGDGSDGAFSASSGSTTLTRDMYWTNLTLTGSASINTAGYAIFGTGILDATAAPTGAIARNGNAGGNASGSTAGTAGSANSSNRLGGSTAGAAGGTGGAAASNGSVGNNSNAFTGNGGIGQLGATGGAGNATTGGASGSVGAQTSFPIRRLETNQLKGITLITGGGGAPGGGGGGGDSSTNAGGGGGGGGSGGNVVMIFFNNISVTGGAAGAIRALGANGGNGGVPAGAVLGAGGGAGGGGGGGGYIYIAYVSKTGTNSTLVDVTGGPGGNGGNGTGTGKGGNGGGAGAGGVLYAINMTTGILTVSTGAVVVAPTTTVTVTGATGATPTTSQFGI